MEYLPTTTVFSYGSSKTAALYSDYVIPLYILEKLDTPISINEIYPSILPPDFTAGGKCYEKYTEYLEVFGEFFVKTLSLIIKDKIVDNINKIDKKDMNAINSFAIYLMQTTLDGQKAVKVRHDFLDSIIEPIDGIIGLPNVLMDTTREKGIASILSGINLIDENSISWESVLEIRKDKKSLSRLKNLRRYLYKNYKYDNEDFIKEELLRMIAEYEATAQQWGFPLIPAIFKCLLPSKILDYVSAAGTLHSFGVPTRCLMAGFALALTADIAWEMDEFEESLDRSPVTYLMNVKNLSTVQD